MLSKAHIHMSKQLKKIAKTFKLTLLTEVKEGNKRYDFYFPTKPPVVIEVDGNNHQLKKADGYFFKSDTQLINYKLNDVERNNLSKLGKIKLFRFSDKDFPTIPELLEIFGNEIINILKSGDDKFNANYKTYERNRQFNQSRKNSIRKQKEKS